jgi:hypothetical protein|tara:strand:- start:295 stop:1089 length:795 start_codon:yes stop_codon:yes gene_type:complete
MALAPVAVEGCELSKAASTCFEDNWCLMLPESGEWFRKRVAHSKAAHAEAGAVSEKWWSEWNERLDDWWIATPYRQGLQACMGALSLHLANRLDTLFRSWRALHFWKPDTASQPPRDLGENCEWVGESGAERLDLPDFPDFPIKFELPPVIPIPRLLPSFEELQSRTSTSGAKHAASLPSQRSASVQHAQPPAWEVTLLGAGAGAAGAALAFGAMACFCRSIAGRGGTYAVRRGRRQMQPTPRPKAVKPSPLPCSATRAIDFSS